MTTGKALDGKPYAGNPHVRFDEGKVAPAAKPRRGSLLYNKLISMIYAMVTVTSIVVTMPLMSIADQTRTEWFVDMSKLDDTGSGRSEATAFKTIKAAIAEASDGDIVTVLPGIYRDEWDVDDYGYTNRVYLRKSVHLRSKRGPKETYIVGRHDPTTDGNGTTTAGVGSAAVRCVLGVTGAIVEGFTLADGAGHTTGNDVYHSWAGGATQTAASQGFYLVNCVVTNCTGYRGGAVRYATAVRCRFEKNYGGSGQVARDLVAVNSLIVGNGRGGGYITDSGTVLFVNCTIAANNTKYAHANGQFVNCVELPTTGGGILSSSSGVIALTNSVLSYTTLNTTKMTADEISVMNPQKPQFIASAIDDWRIVKGSAAEGIGDAFHLAAVPLPVSIDPFVDLDGRPIPKTGMIQAGCIQSTSEPAGGAVVFSTAGTLNGIAVPYVGMSAYPTEYPAQWNFKSYVGEGQSVYAYVHNGEIQFPLMDDSLAFMPPSDVNEIVTNEAKITSRVYYVDPNGNNDNDGLSPKTPFKTLQRAVSEAPSSSAANYDSTMVVVIAAPGDYAEDGALGGGVSNRIYSTNKRIRFKGTGRDVTTIWGRHDKEGPAGDGRGVNAVRCAYISGFPSALQGFTLADGACSYEGDGTGSTVSQFGGAVYGSVHILDCSIVNGSAYRGAAAYSNPAGGIRIMRTRVTGCIAGNGISGNGVNFFGCLISGNDGTIRNEDRVRHCTIYAAEGTRVAIVNGTMATNCVIREFGVHNLGSSSVNCTGGNVLNGFASIYPSYAEKSNSTEAPQFADANSGDFRVRTTSPALTVGVFDPDYWKYYTLDVDSRKILFFDGRPVAGAVQDVQQVIASPASSYCTIEPVGERVMEPGDSVTYTANGFIRPPLGFATNGVPVAGASDSFSYVYDGTLHVGAFDGGLTYLFDTNWYVNAETGLDSNTGFTAEMPKKTLEAAMDVELLTGDVVHLAEGIYSNGLMGTASTYVSNRVVIAKAILLVGDGDNSNTIIEGAASPNPVFTEGGCDLGPGAVRCGYFVGSGATVRNVTFRNGHTYYLESSATSADCHGGGVAASADVVFEDCIFANNRACRAGGAWGGTFRRCVFIDNWAQAKGSHTMSWGDGNGAHCYNCHFGRGFGQVTQEVGDMVGCLFENEQYKLDGTTVWSYGIVPNASCIFANNIVLCGLFMPTTDFYPSNCVYISTANSSGAAYFHPVNCIQTNATSVAEEIDATTRKIVSHTSWLVDAGATEYVATGGNTDLGRGQRIYNGAVDIGPFEFDWRKQYARDIGRALDVTFASPGVFESSRHIALPDGESIFVSINDADAGIKGVDVCVSEGELYACGGYKDETFLTDGIYSVTSPANLSFAYSGEGCAMINGVMRRDPGFFITVR